jgi:tetratricopeptide (TPR) repeat protein
VVGSIRSFTDAIVVLRDRHDVDRPLRNQPGGFLVDGEPATLVPHRAAAAPAPTVKPARAPAPAEHPYEIDLGDEVVGGEGEAILLEEEGEGEPDLEEADFYFGQGLLADALPIYREYVKHHPGNAQVKERIEEISRRLGKIAPSAAPRPQAPPPPPPPPPVEEITIAGEAVIEEEVELTAAAEEAVTAFEPAGEVAAEEPVAEEEQGLIAAAEEAVAAFEPAGEASAGEPVTEEEPITEEELALAAAAEEAIAAFEPTDAVLEAEPSQAGNVPGGGARFSVEKAGQAEEFFDLAAELDEEISQLEEAKGANLDETPVEDLESVFREFQEGVVAAIGEEDSDTHYNLGIAYKEMGLFSEAIAEFELAIRSPERSWDAAVMLGICYRERGDYPSAIDAFTKALLISDREDDEYVGLRYELAQVYEKAGKFGEALVLFREIQSRQKGFADVSDRIARLAEQEEDRLASVQAETVREAAERAAHRDEQVIAAPGSEKAGPAKVEPAKPKKNRVSYL